MTPPTQLRRSTPRPAPSTRFDASANCFFNAVLHETDLGRYEQTASGPAYLLDLDDEQLMVPCRHRSAAGRHHLAVPCRRRADGTVEPVTFPAAVRATLAGLPVDDEAKDRLLRRVLRSDRDLRYAVEDVDDLDAVFEEPLSFGEAETTLLVGHSMHPCPKDRTGFSRADARRYAPEHQGRFPLTWVAADPAVVHLWEADGAGHRAIVEDLARDAPRLADRLTDAGDDRLVPCHPYQLEHWQAHPALADAFRRGDLRVLGPSDRAWRPTTSLRTLYSEDAAWMPKFSLTVKLTNSLRHLHPDELARGPQITDLLQTPNGRALRDRFDRLRILDEPVSLALRSDEGEVVDATGIVWRDNPFIGDAAENTEVLATLLQDDPRDGVPRLIQRLRATGNATSEAAARWLDRFLDLFARPMLLAEADHGIWFTAHQQNVILDLDGVRPTTVYIRDSQGACLSPRARDRMPDVVDELADDGALVFDDPTTCVLLTYYVIVNSVFNVISTLGRAPFADEAELLDRYVAFLEGLLDEDPTSTSVVDHLLSADELQIKGNFHYALTGIDETTQDNDLLDLYQPIPNPIREGDRR